MTDARRESALIEQVDAMTLNRSATTLAEPASRGREVTGANRQELFSRDELALISLFADGLCIETIARRLDLSDRTIRRRSRALCDRLGVTSTIQLVAWAARRQLI